MYNETDMTITSDYLTLSEYTAKTVTINTPAGDASRTYEYYYDIDVSGSSTDGSIDTVQIIYEGRAYPCSAFNFTDSNGNSCAFEVYRTSPTTLKAYYAIPRTISSSQPYPAHTFQVKLQSYKNPLGL